MKRSKTLHLGVIFFAALVNPGGTSTATADNATRSAHPVDPLTLSDPYTLQSPVHLVDGVDPVVDEKHVRAVIEIPAGSTQKWEVDKADGHLKWEMKAGAPRVIDYIGYPGNYGLIPRSLVARHQGGDNDPLAILVLGPPLPRGSIVKARVIGMLNMRDGGQSDNKLIAVTDGQRSQQSVQSKNWTGCIPASAL